MKYHQKHDLLLFSNCLWSDPIKEQDPDLSTVRHSPSKEWIHWGIVSRKIWLPFMSVLFSSTGIMIWIPVWYSSESTKYLHRTSRLITTGVIFKDSSRSIDGDTFNHCGKGILPKHFDSNWKLRTSTHSIYSTNYPAPAYPSMGCWIFGSSNIWIVAGNLYIFHRQYNVPEFVDIDRFAIDQGWNYYVMTDGLTCPQQYQHFQRNWHNHLHKLF